MRQKQCNRWFLELRCLRGILIIKYILHCKDLYMRVRDSTQGLQLHIGLLSLMPLDNDDCASFDRHLHLSVICIS